MTVIRNKNHHADFDTFNTYKDAINFLDNMPKKIRKDYEIVTPQRNPLDAMKVR